MRKSMIFAAIAAVSGIAVSCSKSEVLSYTSEPIKLTLTAEMPGMDADTKMSFNPDNDKEVFWQSGDKIRLFVQNAMPCTSSVEGTGWTDCGEFTTTDSGSKLASFTGTIPSDAVGNQYGIAIFPADRYVSGSITATKYSTGVASYYLNAQVNIPAEQDGTGIKYMQGIAKFAEGKLGTFFWSSGMFKMTLPAGRDIRKIVLTKTTGTKSLVCDHSIYFKNDAAKITTAEKNNKSMSVTVYNAGAELSGVQYITVRNGDAADVLSLSFYDSTDALIKSFTINTSSATSMNYGKICNLGDLSSKF